MRGPGSDQNGLLAAGPVSRIFPDRNRLLGRANTRLPECAGCFRKINPYHRAFVIINLNYDINLYKP